MSYVRLRYPWVSKLRYSRSCIFPFMNSGVTEVILRVKTKLNLCVFKFQTIFSRYESSED